MESLENMDKTEFLPLGTVKQEMIDTGNGISGGSNNANSGDATETNGENNEINSATTNNGSDPIEVINPVCDSAEKQVRIRRQSRKT